MVRKIAPPKAPEKIAPTAIEISVARNGFLKPYAVCFQHLPDNIAREPLGMLAGAMTINDRSEHSAYIVNFLASLAKKEYYGNPRRDAIESFEASLHKINVGLAELAKEGNTEWIGTLDAAICIVERNNLHFSVAGNAKVLLFRDRHLSDISEGLADSSEDHPMKTFTDVASGKISPGDRLLITTPDIFSALSETELERSANRLPHDQFERLLQTAAINQLDLSASVLITIGTIAEYRQKPAPKRTLATVDSVPNAWSHAIFESSKQQGNSIEAGLKEKKVQEEDRVDNKTGHIYVTGETPNDEANETWERTQILLADILASFKGKLSYLRRTITFLIVSGAHSLRDLSKRLASKGAFAFRSWQENKKTRQEEHSQITPPEIPSQQSLPHEQTSPLATFSEKTRQAVRSIPRLPFFTQQTVHIPVEGESKITLTMRALSERGSALLSWFMRIFSTLRQSFNTLSPQKRRLFLRIGAALLSVGIIGMFLRGFFTSNNVPATTQAPQETGQPTAETPEATPHDTRTRVIEGIETINAVQDIVSITRLQETLFVITKDALYNTGSDGKSTTQIAYPDGARARAGVSMPALNAILILTESGTVLFFTPSTNRFDEERFTLPDAGNIIGITTSSTYLYTLNHADDMLFRYPRIKGGFGPATPWFKEPVSIEPGATLAVSDSVFIADASGIRSYFRGTAKTVQFETPTIPLSPTEVISTSSGETSNELFILDGSAGRILRYDTDDGTITAQYTSDAIKGAAHFAIDQNASLAFVSVGDTVIMAPLK